MHDSGVAIVTGAGSGIGLAVAHRLIAEGYRLAVCDLDAALAETFAAAIAEGRAVCVVGDVSDAGVRDRLIASVRDHFGRLDVLVNNAATGGSAATVRDMDLDSLRRTLDINVVSVVALTQAAIPMLAESPCGSVVNLSSVFASDPVVGGGEYCASKGAIDVLTKVLALELGPLGITCNSVAPGYILTRMHTEEVEFQAQARGITTEQRFAELRAEVPVGRHGHPEDVADAIVWLAGPGSRYVSGHRLAVNGGIDFS